MNDQAQGPTRADQYPNTVINAQQGAVKPMPPIERVIKRQNQIIQGLEMNAEALYKKLELMMSPIEQPQISEKPSAQGEVMSAMADGINSNNNSIKRVSRLLQKIMDRIEI